MTTIKKYTLIVVLSILASINTIAQTVTNRFEFGNPDMVALSIPKEFSFNGIPYLVMYDNSDENTILVYDENLDVVKTIQTKDDKSFNYKLTYQKEERDVVAVTEISKRQYCEFYSYENFIEKLKIQDPAFDESQLIVTDQENGDKRISVNYTNTGLSSNEMMYYAYSYFGMEYPRVYFILTNGKVIGYQAMYAVSYSDWKIMGTYIEDCSAELNRIRLCNINLNLGDGRANNYYFEVSQTLFNTDEAFEYIIPKYKLSSKGNISGSTDSTLEPGGEERIITKRTTLLSEERELSLAGFQIVSEDGNVISDLTFDGGFEGNIYIDYAFVITIGNSTYLAFDGNCNEESSTIFYKINRETSSVNHVKKTPASMVLAPTVVNKSSTIDIKFSDGNEDGSDIVVVSMSGIKVKELKVPVGQTTAQFNIQAQSGVYCVARLQKNKATEIKKIIVK